MERTRRNRSRVRRKIMRRVARRRSVIMQITSPSGSGDDERRERSRPEAESIVASTCSDRDEKN